ncbi:inositol 1,4,5-triphosphate receptor associated 1 [Hemicordylus capensis]|uniref:inositol 1,4,5-triphosphate receptor associated 1 n=1 Tax=Hemicordylus capensis TaxID=884348 RepID=UPI002303C385|nr:inositol 1,4,5-triphosphate receptor associated 1 [Hemicordylus capensis]
MSLDCRSAFFSQGNTISAADELITDNMSDSADCSEDDLINITFEVCSTKETGAVPASGLIKYLEEITGHSPENSRLLLLYNMLDPERRNVLVGRETFYATMKKWIAICCQDCISESEADKNRTTTSGNLQYNDMFLSDEDAEIFEGRADDSEMAFDLHSSVEELKYMNRKMTEKLLGVQKVMEVSEETCLQLTDDVVKLRGRLTSMQKPIGNIKYICNELEDTKSKMANLHEGNNVICGCITSLHTKTQEERSTTLCEALLHPHSQEHFQNFLQELKSQKNSMFQALMEEIELKQKMGHSLIIVIQMLANLCPFMETWNQMLKRLEMFLEGPQLWAKSACCNNVEIQKTEELGETNECLEQSTVEAKIPSSTISDHCCFERTKTSASKCQFGTFLNKTALQSVGAVSFNSQMFTQTDQISEVPQIWGKILEAGGKLGNPEERLEVILEIARSLAKDTNKELEGGKGSNKHISEHKIQFEQKKEKMAASAKLKESVLRILRELREGVSASSVTDLQINALQLWISEDEGKLIKRYSKEASDNSRMEGTMSKLSQSTACCESTPVLPPYFPFLTSLKCYFDNDNSKLQTSLIEALNLEHTSTEKRCCRTFPYQLLGQRPRSKENLLNKRRHTYKTEHGRNNKRTLEVNSQASIEDGIKHLHSKPLSTYSAVTQRPLDQKSPPCLSSEVNWKQTFPSVRGLLSPQCSPKCPSLPIMPTLPEDVGQPTEAHHSILPAPIKESPAEAATCSTPQIVLPENTIIPDAEREKNLAFRPVSPNLRHSNRHARTSASSLTSVDNAGHVIDLVNDQLPDVKISDEDKKKNLELLEEAKRVSERFLSRRGRKSRSSLSESPTAISPTLSPSVSPAPSRSNSFTLPSPTGSDISTTGSLTSAQNATNGLTDQKQNDQGKVSQGRLVPHTTSFENPKDKLSEQKENFDPHKPMDNLSKSCTSGTNTCRISLNSSTNICANELGKLFTKKTKENNFPFKGHLQVPGMVTLDPKSKGSAPLPKDSKVSCKTELNTSGSRPPLLRAVSWDHVESANTEKASFKTPSEDDKNFAISNKSSNNATKSSAFKDLQIQVQPVRMQKLTKLREEHILMRNQNLVGLKLPDLSEAAEQERGPSPVPFLLEEEEEEEETATIKNRCDVMPNVSDILLRKLRVHTSLSESSPPLTEKEIENVFVQLSLAFRNDSYTLESRINLAERERNLAEENTEKELENFKVAITSSASLWHHSEHREMYQKLLEDIAVLHRLASRLSSRAEMVGAVRQEKRMSKATEVMMQYVDNLKRTYEKDHAELMEFKKLANQNSSRSYGSPEDGVPRTSRSMSLSIGKMPRRRVSVAVVSKFELPGQSPVTSPIPLMPSLSESSNGRSNLTSTTVLPAVIENGKSIGDPDGEPAPSVPIQSSLEEINPETKAKIEEEAYNKGYQEGLKKTKELEELKEDDEEKIDESPNECKAGESDDEISKQRSKLEVVIHYVQILYPKLYKHWNVLWIVAAIIVIFAVVLGISSLYNYFSSCTEVSDGPQVKAACSAVQQYSWWNSGLQRDQHTE